MSQNTYFSIISILQTMWYVRVGVDGFSAEMAEEFMEQKDFLFKKEGIQLFRYNIMFRIISDEELENYTMNYPDAPSLKVFDSLDVLINLKRKSPEQINELFGVWEEEKKNNYSSYY